jgi:hypothetical protein
MWWKGICTWTTCIAIGLGSQHAMASVSGIVENFSGRGEFDSLHYPGWLRDGGVFEVGGGLRYNTSLDYDSVAFAITGEGSFKTIVQFSEVDMGNVGSQDPIDSAYSNIFLDQLARNGGWYTQVHKGWQNSEKYMVRFGGPERNVVDVVGSIRLENEYNAETHTGATRYVGGVDDPESIVVNTRQIDGGLVGNIVTQVMLNLTNEYGTEFDPPIEMNVLLDYILVLPLDAELGDFSGNGILDGEDVEMLKRASTLSVVEPFFDLNSDQIVDSKDLEHWVQVVRELTLETPISTVSSTRLTSCISFRPVSTKMASRGTPLGQPVTGTPTENSVRPILCLPFRMVATSKAPANRLPQSLSPPACLPRGLGRSPQWWRHIVNATKGNHEAKPRSRRPNFGLAAFVVEGI